jgi:imidazolonepropionase-like amidohydrolase
VAKKVVLGGIITQQMDNTASRSRSTMPLGYTDAGFTPLEAIKIASFNGAQFLGEDAHIGSIAVGKQADLMVLKGNPATHISDIEKVEIAVVVITTSMKG